MLAFVVALAIPLTLLWVACVFSIVGLAVSREPLPGPSVETLIRRCDGLEGWALVERAQHLVHAAMPGYGYFNGFDTPRLALERGLGLCWHRALVLRSVLRAQGLEAQAVHAFHNRFESGVRSGHVWLQVKWRGEVRAVCPGEATNTPGVVRFKSLSRVRPFGTAIMLATWLGSPIANVFVALVRIARGAPVLPSTGTPLTLRARVSRNALWLLIPILGWNAALASRLPAPFLDDHAVPAAVLAGEALGRLLVMGAPAVLLFGARSTWQRRGLALFGAGTLLYFLSWLPPLLLAAPSWAWVAPYLLPSAWLAGLGLATRSGAYLVGAALFTLAHGAHGVIVIASLVGR